MTQTTDTPARREVSVGAHEAPVEATVSVIRTA